ncbi:hypothetical protein [Caballeronia sp. 15711]
MLNVDGGSISIGQPFGTTGARLSGHGLIASPPFLRIGRP